MKNTKKIGVLISLLLISLIALSAVSAADDVAVDDADVAAVDEVVEVNDAPATNEIDTGSEDIVSDSDSGDLQDQSDAADEVVADAVSPKNTVKVDALGAEPDGSWADLYALINGASAGSTITLDRNYVYNTSTDAPYVRTDSRGIFNHYEYYGLMISKNLIIDGAGFTLTVAIK